MASLKNKESKKDTIKCTNMYKKGAPAGEERTERILEEKHGRKCTKCDERHESTHPRNSMNWKKDKFKENQTKTHYI